MTLTKRESREARSQELIRARRPWEPTLQDIGDNFVPRRVRLNENRRMADAGRRRDSKIINNTPVRAARTLGASLMAFLTSPARDWFGLTASEPGIAERPNVKRYLDASERIIKWALQASNFYRALSNDIYPDLATLATAAMWVEEHPVTGVHFRPMICGEYWLDVDESDKMDTCYREIDRTVRQVVQRFGLENVSPNVKRFWDNSDYATLVPVRHLVSPAEEGEHRPGALGPDGMPVQAVWWDANDQRKDATLATGGYTEFPVLAPRWMSVSGEAYGYGPGWEALGDAKQLQHMEREKLGIVDKLGRPPMKKSPDVKRASIIPGATTTVGSAQGEGMFEPAVKVDPRGLQAVKDEVEAVSWRLDRTMYVELLRFLIDDQRSQPPTAREVDAKREQSMLLFGPLLTNLDGELFETTIQRTQSILDRNDKLPMPPEELQGTNIGVKFISIMHQVQQSTGLGGVRTLVAEASSLAQLTGEEVLDKINGDFMMDEIGRMSGVSGEAIRSKEEVEEKRRIRAEGAQQQAQQEQMQQGVEMAAKLGSVDPDNIRGLGDMVSPAAAAQGGLPQSGGPQ